MATNPKHLPGPPMDLANRRRQGVATDRLGKSDWTALS